MKLKGERPKGRVFKTMRYHAGEWVVFTTWSSGGLQEWIGRIVVAGFLACDVVVFDAGKERIMPIQVTSIIAVIPAETALAMLEVQGRLM